MSTTLVAELARAVRNLGRRRAFTAIAALAASAHRDLYAIGVRILLRRHHPVALLHVSTSSARILAAYAGAVGNVTSASATVTSPSRPCSRARYLTTRAVLTKSIFGKLGFR